jgi:hypothetical protein
MKFAAEAVMTLLVLAGIAAAILAAVLGVMGLLAIDVSGTLMTMVLVAAGFYVVGAALRNER